MFYEMVKRIIDVIASAIALTLGLPLMVPIAIAIKWTSPGPIFYRHDRLGLGGRLFRCVKFRSMRVDADRVLEADPELRKEFDKKFKLDADPRLTPIGGFLRKTSLDELPQFWCILRGDMSMIGPRPIVPREVDKYGHRAAQLLTVKPGLGGAWQAMGRSGTTYRDRIIFDMWYIKHRCILLDLRLMILTAWTAVRGHGAC